ncbi:DUF177 domain-containing protein [Naumannella sp. ID2617S]|nr:DUF177 domain-containing protein [Naumannella sp. ID2617S]
MSTSARPLDRRDPLVIDTHDLGRRAGAMKELHTSTEAPEGIGGDVIGVPTGSPIQLDLRLESVVEGVLVTGTAEVTVVGQCGRCLDPIEQGLEIDVQELYLYPGTEPDDAEASRMEGELIDLEPLVRDEVVLELPFMPLCRDDCEGLCPTCGANLNADPEHRHDEAVDPRWGDLAAWQNRSDN